ncbi:hypothetical protein [Streptomyces sp. NBC_01210]|uniref:hypothetical protein n=1 Tax=Streptomyces sp. NBC_01210 TaxID=2903774 RepID=UPI003FA36617
MSLKPLAVDEHQLREYANNPPGRLRLRLGEFYPVPDVELPDSATHAWLEQLAQLTGELHDLLALPLDKSDYADAELGMEVDPPAPYAPGARLTMPANQLRLR